MMATTWIMIPLLRCERDVGSIATIYNANSRAPAEGPRTPQEASHLVRLLPLRLERAERHCRPGDADRARALCAESRGEAVRGRPAGVHVLRLSHAARG